MARSVRGVLAEWRDTRPGPLFFNIQNLYEFVAANSLSQFIRLSYFRFFSNAHLRTVTSR